MRHQITLFNMRTLSPNYQTARSAPVAICGHCRHLVTIRNDAAHRFYYCGITECPNSIIGCKPVKPTRAACRRYRPGRGEFLRADQVFQPAEENE